jgi:T-complex protein 1 subunit gamma
VKTWFQKLLFQILNLYRYDSVERNLHDAMGVARNVVHDPRLLPGGGAVEMAVSRAISEEAMKIEGVEALPFRAIGIALEVIPRTLAQNCGANVIRTLTKLRAKHAEATEESTGGKACTFGIDGDKGTIVDMKELGVWEAYAVKVGKFVLRTYKPFYPSSETVLPIE